VTRSGQNIQADLAGAFGHGQAGQRTAAGHYQLEVLVDEQRGHESWRVSEAALAAAAA
jgi:hypothetical protein